MRLWDSRQKLTAYMKIMTDSKIDTSSIAQSPDPAEERRAQLAALVPEAFSEGQLDVSARPSAKA